MSNPADDYVKPGDVLDGKYLVERVLGAGGMGIVVQAKHKTLNKRVAIKFMRPDQLGDGESVARFQREAKAAASLQSEHTARVQDTGRLENGAPYMVMEFLVGSDLGELLERSGRMPHGRAVELVLQACEALAEAHARGIVHRDVKPRNLFLAHTVDGRPLVKVLDFGLAKDLDSSTDRALTATTAVMGSPQYMSPEQMRASRDVDRRTDIWSMGVCLYELLTAKMPFDAPTVPMLCAMVLKEDPAPPHLVNPAVPLPLSDAVMRCLQKTASDRFVDIADFAAAIEPFGDGASQGAAARVRGVLTSTRLVSDAPPPHLPPRAPVAARAVSGALDNTLAHSDTRTAASFDSKPKKKEGPTHRAVVGMLAGASALGLALVVVVAFPGKNFRRAGEARPVGSESAATGPGFGGADAESLIGTPAAPVPTIAQVATQVPTQVPTQIPNMATALPPPTATAPGTGAPAASAATAPRPTVTGRRPILPTPAKPPATVAIATPTATTPPPPPPTATAPKSDPGNKF